LRLLDAVVGWIDVDPVTVVPPRARNDPGGGRIDPHGVRIDLDGLRIDPHAARIQS
jgi:hypothetical protein